MTEETLFALALERPSGAERRAFLDAACGGDRWLRDRVEQLLAADERSRGILEQGPAAAAVLAACHPDATASGPSGAPPVGGGPRVIPEADPPGYELSEQVGEGGMGVVYRARDTRLNRDVAVKFLRARFASDGPAARRFLGEARVTAQLQHPGTPPVHQVGALPDGRPFLVMKLIKGRTLADLLADERADRGRLLAAFEQVCQAVAFAHSRGIVHRDLKPANVMVGAFGEVQVMDWGLAKDLASRERERPEPDGGHEAPAAASVIDTDRGAEGTRTGTVLGTPAYMPPEQATGAVDQVEARSDVFGLGAILCAVLTGRPPYAAADFESTRQLAAQARLGDAFTRLDACGADPGLVELCKRCLAAEKADRPADAGEVARAVADLRAAADERARVAELDRVRAEGDRAKAEAEAREQRKRRRVQLALVAALGVLVIGGGAFGWYTDHHATKHRDRLEENAKAVAALLDQCEAALRADEPDQAAIALEAAERRAADGGAEELAGRLDRCRADLRLLRELDRIDTFRWTWTGRGFPHKAAWAERWRAVLAEYGVTRDEGRAAESAERVNGSLVRDRLLAALDECLAIDQTVGLRAVLRAADPHPYRDAVRDAVVAVGGGDLLAELASRPEALAQPARFAAVLARFTEVPKVRKREVLASALRTRPGNLNLLMAMAETYPTNQSDGAGKPEGAGEPVRWYQAAVAAHPGHLAALVNLSIALWDRGDADGAIATAREAVRANPQQAKAHETLGFMLRRIEDLDGAIAAYREAVRLDRVFVDAHYGLGVSLRTKGDLNGAIAAYREAVRLDPGYADAHYRLGNALKAKGDLNGAIAAYQEAVRFDPESADAQHGLANALKAREDAGGASADKEAVRADPQQAKAHYNQGNALKARGDLNGAIAAYREAGRADPGLAAAHFQLGFALREKGDLNGAIAAYREAVRADPSYTAAHFNLGNALKARRDYDGAIASFKEALRLDPLFAEAHYNLGAVLCDEKRNYDAAIASFEETIRLNPNIALAHNGLAVARRAKGDVNGAVAALREAVRADPSYTAAHYRLGVLLCDEKRDYDGAIAAFQEVTRLEPNNANAHYNLGHAQRCKGDAAAAAANFRRVIRLSPRNSSAHDHLAWILATGPDRLRDGKQAVVYATRACDLSGWTVPLRISTLGAAYAEAGDFARAVEFERKALSDLDYAKRFGKTAQERLELYAQKKPCRDPSLASRELAPPPREVKP
jgi:tetratricopeptide (TPR) repeat protein